MKKNYLLFTLTVIITSVVGAEPVDIMYKAPNMPVTQNKVRPVADNPTQEITEEERAIRDALRSLQQTINKEKKFLIEDKVALATAKAELENANTDKKIIIAGIALSSVAGVIELRYGWNKGSEKHIKRGAAIAGVGPVIGVTMGLPTKVRLDDTKIRIARLEEKIKEREKFLTELEEGINITREEMNHLSK